MVVKEVVNKDGAGTATSARATTRECAAPRSQVAEAAEGGVGRLVIVSPPPIWIKWGLVAPGTLWTLDILFTHFGAVQWLLNALERI